MPLCLGRIDDKKTHEVRITNAKISYIESDRKIVIGIAYEICEFQHLRKVWKFDKLQLNFQATNEG